MDRRLFVAASVAGWLTSFVAAGARTPTKAIVFGLGYENAPGLTALVGAPADAGLIAATLEKAKISVSGPHARMNAEAFWVTLRQFAAGLRRSDAAIFFFAGHGVQVNGQNYLLSDDGASLIPLSDIAEALRAQSDAVVMFVDACRENPLVGASGDKTRAIVGARRGAVRATAITSDVGLARMSTQGPGVLYVFSTDPDRVAQDVEQGGRNSPFAAALSQLLPDSRALEEILADVTARVSAATGGQQTPWRQGSLTKVIYLAGEPNEWMRAGSLTAPTLPPP